MALVLRWPTRRRRRSLQTRWPKQPVRLVALYLCPSCWKKTRSWPDWDWDQEVPLWVPCSSVATSRRRCRPSRTIWRPSSWNGATSSPPLSTARILTWPPFNASLTWGPLVMFFSCSPQRLFSSGYRLLTMKSYDLFWPSRNKEVSSWDSPLPPFLFTHLLSPPSRLASPSNRFSFLDKWTYAPWTVIYCWSFAREIEKRGEEGFRSTLIQSRISPRVIFGALSNLDCDFEPDRIIIIKMNWSQEYKKPLEESNPPILGSNKISTLFHRIPEILQCHTLFRLALSECARTWDKEEKIGDVFVANFSKAVVLDIYSDFINNFSQSLDVAKQESKRKSALADFLKVLSFFLPSPVWRPPTKLLSHRRSIGQADILARPAVVLWSHGQARPKISSIHPPTSGK